MGKQNRERILNELKKAKRDANFKRIVEENFDQMHDLITQKAWILGATTATGNPTTIEEMLSDVFLREMSLVHEEIGISPKAEFLTDAERMEIKKDSIHELIYQVNRDNLKHPIGGFPSTFSGSLKKPAMPYGYYREGDPRFSEYEPMKKQINDRINSFSPEQIDSLRALILEHGFTGLVSKYRAGEIDPTAVKLSV